MAKLTREKAQKVADSHKIKKVYGNSNGEAFTNYNLAVLSEGGKKDNIDTFEFNEPVQTATPVINAEQGNAGDAEAAADGVGKQTPVKTKIFVLDEKDLANDPTLAERGFKAGDKVVIPTPPFGRKPKQWPAETELVDDSDTGAEPE